jgi:predicted HicB family RNase H-like nuclease
MLHQCPCGGIVRCNGFMAASRVLTSERHDVILPVMAQAKRATVYLDPTLHRALRVKAAETDLSVSELVNNAVRAGR